MSGVVVALLLATSSVLFELHIPGLKVYMMKVNVVLLSPGLFICVLLRVLFSPQPGYVDALLTFSTYAVSWACYTALLGWIFKLRRKNAV